MTLYIRNFQGIGEETIDLEGFTVFTGKTNSGKSTIRRAIEAVLYNIWDKRDIKKGQTDCVIKITIDDKNYIQISKPTNTYSVMVGGEVTTYPKVGRNQIPEVGELGLGFFYDGEGYEHSVHVRKQIDAWYYFSASKTGQSRIIASIFEFDQIKNIIKTAYDDKRSVTASAEKKAEDIDKLKVELREYSGRASILKDLEQVMTDRNNLNHFQKIAENINTHTSALGILDKRIPLFDSAINSLNDLSTTTTFIKKHQSIQSGKLELTNLETARSHIENKTIIAQGLAKDIDSQQILKNHLEDYAELQDNQHFLSSLHDSNKQYNSQIEVSKEIGI